mmetsp:Transcript_1596/g.2981  ORF Transcript_1596/g.2981 Transcript_1596/m.2981 type:complete len:97 (-) Transcript_1596:472-762(-)
MWKVVSLILLVVPLKIVLPLSTGPYAKTRPTQNTSNPFQSTLCRIAGGYVENPSTVNLVCPSKVVDKKTNASAICLFVVIDCDREKDIHIEYIHQR